MALDLDLRAARHAALGDPSRLAVVDALVRADRAPVELQDLFGRPSNLLSHHLDVLEQVGLITRTRSSGDGRRRYVHLLVHALDGLVPRARLPRQRALFVCTQNSARSQLAAVLWRQLTGTAASSAGTEPAKRVHPGALAAARRAGLDLAGASPRSIETGGKARGLVITVCDRAHEALAPGVDWLHWSIVDPVPLGTGAAFDATLEELRSRITSLVGPASVDL